VALMIPPTGAAFDGRTFVLWQAYLSAGVVIALMLIPLSRRMTVFPARLRQLTSAVWRSRAAARLGGGARQKS
jgi:hypothetical protein